MKSEKMRKTWFLPFSFLICAFAAQAELVEYRDYDATRGTFSNAVRECTLVTSETRTLESGWYAVKDAVTVSGGSRMAVRGAAHLILCDGATLTAEGGIEVASGMSLDVSAQGEGEQMGALVATGSQDAAGIGSGRYKDAGAISIYGGRVTATGGDQGAGIGGGAFGAGGTILIAGGVVTATGRNGATGIGGAGGDITISGGVVTATGSANAAGIGSGNGRNCGTVTISGGVVTATGGYGGAGIGGGYGGIGNGGGGTITISGGTVKATGGRGGADIGSGEGGAAGAVTIDGGSVLATRASFNGAPTNSAGQAVHCVTVEGLDGAVCLDGLGDYGTVGVASVDGKIGLWLPDGNYEFTVNGIDYSASVDGENTTADGGPCEVEYWDPTDRRLKTQMCVRIKSTTTTLGDGWYVVRGSVSCGALTVNGLAHLVLCDGCELTAGPSATFGIAGINVGPGDSLSIYGQASGTGRLVATGATEHGAGVGGNDGESCGTVTVNGGVITAAGGFTAAGIGGGYGGSGGVVTVNGGRVTAFCRGYSGAGIGGGHRGHGGTVTINGGFVTATGANWGGSADWSGAGIGGGHAGNGGTVTINGGTVTATAGSDYAADLGGGSEAESAAVVVTGGSVCETHGTGAVQSPGGDPLWCVTVLGLDGFEGLEGLGDYGTNDVVAVDGKIYLWLPNGHYRFTVNGEIYIADVQDGPTTARLRADLGVAVNGVDVEIGAGEGWTYAGGLLTLSGEGPFVVSGTNTEGKVAVVQAAASTVTISNLVLSVTGSLAPYAVTCTSGARMLLAGVNKLTAQFAAAVEVNAGAALTIDGTGGTTDEFLVAVGGEGAAAIGGGSRKVHGRIEICGGTIDAKGGFYGAAIGSGGYAYDAIGEDDQIVISGGFVTASAGSGGAAIGGGYDSVFGPVTVSGGTVDAGGSESRRNDIGNGWNRDGREVTITGGSVLAQAAKITLPPTDGAKPVYCVSVNLGLGSSASGTVALEGLGDYGTDDVIAIDGMLYLYLPDGDYQFKADGEGYYARVAGAATSAQRGFLPTGVSVNGEDLNTLSGTGWTWNRTTSELTCSAGEYVLSGVATGLVVNASLDETAAVVASNLVLKAFNGPLTVGGTTVDLGSLDGLLTVTGGSVRVGGETVASNLTERVWCVTVEVEKVEGVERVEGLDGYGTNEIAAIDGKVYLWLPNGRHAFEVNGVRYYANVVDGPTTAATFAGFAVNGEDVVAGRGTGWALANGLLALDGAETNAFELVGERPSDLGVDVVCGEGQDAVAIRVSGSVLAVTNGLAFALAPKTEVRTVDDYAFAVKADGSLALEKGIYYFNPEGLYDAETLAAVLVADETWQVIDRPEDTGVRANGLDIGGLEWTTDGSACHFNTNDWALSFNQGLSFSLEGTNLTERPIALSLAPDGLSVTFTNLVITSGADAGFAIAAGCDPAYWGFFTNAANTVRVGEGVYAFDPEGRTIDGLTSGRIGADRWRVVPSGSFKARVTVDDVTYSCLTLAEALAFAGRGGRIELDADIEGEPLLVPSGSSFTLVGNGYAIAPAPATTADALVTVSSNCLVAVADVVFDGRGSVTNALAAVESFGALTLEDCTVRGFRVPEGTLVEVDSSLGSAAPALTLSNLATADNAVLGAVGATAGTSILAVNAPGGAMEDVVVLAENAAIAFTNAAPAARLVLNPLDAAQRVDETLVRAIAGGVALDPAKVRICAAGYSAVGDGQGGIVLESVTSRPFAVGADAAFVAYRTFGEAIAAADDGRVAAVYYENAPDGVAMVTNVQDITVGAGTNAVVGTAYRMTPDGTNTVWTFPTDKTAVLAGRIRVKGSLALENVEVVSPLVLDGGVVAVGAGYDLGGTPAEITFADASALAEGTLVVTSAVRSAAQLLDAFCVRMPGYVLTAEAGGLAVRTLGNSFAAKIGDDYFHSLAAAVAAAKDGETVEAITLTNLTRQTVRDTVTAEGTCAVGSGRRVVFGSAVCALDELGRLTTLTASNVQTTVAWPADSRLVIGEDAVLAPSNVVCTGTMTLAGAGVLDLAAYDAGEITVVPQRLGKIAVNASGKLRLADGTDGEIAILANGDAIYRRGTFSARFEETGNGVGKICIDDYGTYSEIVCDGPITSGSVSRHYANPETGVDTEVVVGVLYVDGTHTVVLPTEGTRAAADPRYTAADGSRKPLTGGYLPSDIRVDGETVELWLYGSSFKVSGMDILTKDNREDKHEEIFNAVMDKADDDPSFDGLRDFFGDLFETIVDAGIMAAIYEIDKELCKAIATIRKVISTLEGCVSLLKRMSATVYLDGGDSDSDYYLASDADDAFDKALNRKHVVHFMCSDRIGSYTASKDLIIDMRGAPNLDVSKFACWAKLDLGDETPQFIQNLVNKMMAKMVAEAAKVGTKLIQEATKTPHVSAQYEDDAAPWLRVTGGAEVTVRNFDTDAGSVGPDLPCELMAVDSGTLTLELATICDFRPSAGHAAIRVANGAELRLSDRCDVTGNASAGVPANVFVAAGARLSVDSSSSRVGISGQTEGGEVFAQTGGKNFDWPSIYSNDAHAGDSTYEIEVNARNELCWKWNVPDPDAPSFPEPGDESVAGGRAIDIRMITKEIEPGVVMSYARIWGAPTNAVKGAWYYLKATDDLGDEFLYLPGFKWRAAANGALEAMQQGPEGSCCDVPAPSTVTNRFFRFGAQKEEP